MSGENRRPGAPPGPPWSWDLLADLHAGGLDKETADTLRPQVEADPKAREVLVGLDETRTELGALPDLEIPASVAAKLDTALAQELQHWSAQQSSPANTGSPDGPSSNVVDFAAARRRRRRGVVSAGVGLLTAAAAVVGVMTVTSTPQNTTADNNPQAVSPGSARPLALSGDKVVLSPAEFHEALRSRQYGPLTEPPRLADCLHANGIQHQKPLGAREIVLNEKPAELLILSTGKIGQFRLLAVGPECAAGNPATISNGTFGG